MQAITNGQVVTARTFYYNIPDYSYLSASIDIKCPSDYTGDYRVIVACKQGIFSPESFVNDRSGWTIIKEFSSNEENGNGETWTSYEEQFTSGYYIAMTVAFYVEASGSGLTVGFDNLIIMDHGGYIVINSQPEDLTVTEGEMVSFMAKEINASKT